ncbi:uncharacterized protein LOC142143204 [Mixophyes fleayi]|uniref:uncharacterized protein LOC142143204 n=1 Tax=Mixophyes fleayi TaxID=3061075 RepID=UPI003F4DE3E4
MLFLIHPESPGPQFSPSARPTPPPSARDSGTDEQAGPSSYQPPQAESLEMSPEPEDQTTITLVTVDAPVSGLQEVSPGPAEPSHHQPAPESMDPAREMALSIGAFQQQQTLFMDRQTHHMSQIAAQSRRIHRSNSQLPAGINRLATALEQTNVQLAQMTGAVEALHSTVREGNANVTRLAGQLHSEIVARLPAPMSSATTSAATSRLKEKNCLQQETKIRAYQTYKVGLLPYFSQDEELAYCNDIPGLLFHMGMEYRP